MEEKRKSDALVFFYLMGKLSEKGFIEGSSYQLTGKGFDEALDLHREGYKIDRESVEFLLGAIIPDESDLLQISDLLMAEQAGEI